MNSSLNEPPAGLSRGMKVTIGIIAVLLALLALVVTILSTDDPDVAAAPTASPPSGPTDTPEVPVDPATATPAETDNPGDGDGDSVCGLPAGSQAVPVQAPDVEWELVGVIAAPTDPAIGPGLIEDGLRRCYARNPTGALFAALNFLAQVDDINTRDQAARELTAPGPGRDLALDAHEAESSSGQADSPPFAIAGYSFFNYTDDLTTVDLLFQVGTEGFVRVPMTMRWKDGDWKVEIPGTGDPFAGLEGLTSAAGYTRWGPDHG